MEYRVVNSDSNVAELVTNNLDEALHYIVSKKGKYLILDENENVVKGIKTIHVQRQVIGWEEFEYNVPEDFEDYKSLIEDPKQSLDYDNWEYLEDSADYTGMYEIYDSNYRQIATNESGL